MQHQQEQQEIKLIYFADKGRAEAARICFFIGDIKFQDERITLQEFKEMKQQGAFIQNQLPVLYVNGVQYAQSGAIQRFAAKKAGLYPSDEIGALQTEQTLLTIEEILNKLGTISKVKKQEFSNDVANNFLPSYLQYLENQLKQNDTGYYVGESLSLADIASCSIIQLIKNGQLKNIPSDIVDSYQHLMENYRLFRENPEIIRWEQYRKEQYTKKISPYAIYPQTRESIEEIRRQEFLA